MKMSIQIALGLATAPDNSLGWVTLLRKGLPVSAGVSIQQHLALSDAQLQELLGITAERHAQIQESGVFNPLESDTLYRTARALRQGCSSLNSMELVQKWFTNPQPLLKKQIPLTFLTSTLGGELVVVCLERLKPTKVEAVQPEAPDYAEDEVAPLTL